MIGKPGPFQVIKSEGITPGDTPTEPPRRRYSCPNYEACLSIGCALNWESFTCRGCSGDVNETLLWRAHQEMKKDRVANRICEVPDLKVCNPEEAELKVVGKR